MSNMEFKTDIEQEHFTLLFPNNESAVIHLIRAASNIQSRNDSISCKILN